MADNRLKHQIIRDLAHDLDGRAFMISNPATKHNLRIAASYLKEYADLLRDVHLGATAGSQPDAPLEEDY